MGKKIRGDLVTHYMFAVNRMEIVSSAAHNFSPQIRIATSSHNSPAGRLDMPVVRWWWF